MYYFTALHTMSVQCLTLSHGTLAINSMNQQRQKMSKLTDLKAQLHGICSLDHKRLLEKAKGT